MTNLQGKPHFLWNAEGRLNTAPSPKNIEGLEHFQVSLLGTDLLSILQSSDCMKSLKLDPPAPTRKKKSLAIHGKAQEIRTGHRAVATELGPASCLSSTCKSFDLGHPGEAVHSVFVSFSILLLWPPYPHERLSLRAWPSDGQLIQGRDLRRAPFREGGLADPNPHDSEESGSNYSLRIKDLGSFPVETVKCQPHGNSGSLIK